MDVIKKYFPYLLVILLSIPTIVPLFQAGFFPMHDDTQVSRIYLMARALSDGLFPVRWVEDLGYGFGYPIFNFYAPFPYYIGGILTLLTGDALVATKIVFAGALIGAGLSMYYLVQKFFGKVAAIVSAVLYVYFPYHAVNIYVRGNLSELFAYIFIPLFFASLYALYCAQKKRVVQNLGNIILLAISLALIITSHNLSAYMSLLVGSGVVVASLLTLKRKKVFFLSVLVGLTGGIILSAYYLLPVIFEMQYTNVTSQIGGGADFHDHFVCVGQFWNSPWGYGGSIPGCIDGMSFILGKSNVLLLGAVMIALFVALVSKRKIPHTFLVISATCLMLSVLFLMLPISVFLWEIIPGMEYLQFPWRFLNYFALFFSLLVGFIFWVARQFVPEKAVRLGAVLVIGGTVLVYTKLFTPQEIIARDANFYTNRTYIATTVTKRSDEYLPSSFAKPKSTDTAPTEKITVSDTVTVDKKMSKTGFFTAQVTAKSASTIHFNIAYFPAWQVFVDNQNVPVTIASRGFTAAIPQGAHTVRAQFIQTPVQKTANSISLLGIVLLFVGIIRKATYDRKKTS